MRLPATIVLLLFVIFAIGCGAPAKPQPKRNNEPPYIPGLLIVQSTTHDFHQEVVSFFKKIFKYKTSARI